jgi:hypothetical protein
MYRQTDRQTDRQTYVLVRTQHVCTLTSFSRFYISFAVYDINEEELLLKDTPDVNFKDYGAHYNVNRSYP